MFKGYQITNVLGTSPFEWSKFLDGPQSVKPCRKKIAWGLHALMGTAQAMFATVQCCRYYLNEQGSQTFKIYMVFSAIFYNFDVWLQLANWDNRTALPRFLRGYVDFFKDVERKELNYKTSTVENH